MKENKQPKLIAVIPVSSEEEATFFEDNKTIFEDSNCVDIDERFLPCEDYYIWGYYDTETKKYTLSLEVEEIQHVKEFDTEEELKEACKQVALNLKKIVESINAIKSCISDSEMFICS